jgi:L-glutamine-phosphate cytidylyltransferase
VVDRGWRRSYEGRRDHPVSEAELTLVENGVVRCVGKGLVAAADAAGEFIGLAAFSAAAATRMRAEFAAQKARLSGPGSPPGGHPFGSARSFERAYLTDLLNQLVDAGAVMHPVFIDGHWREIDTVEDLERVRREIEF